MFLHFLISLPSSFLGANLILTRHYQTHFNKLNLYTGQLDIPILNPNLNFNLFKNKLANQ